MATIDAEVEKGAAPRRGQKRPRAEGTFAEAVLASVTCPISHSLVVRPVLAEDGKCYERAHIEKWLRQKKSSPLTNKPMGTRLADHGDGRLIVSSAIENGLVDADAATAWHVASARLKIVSTLPGGLDSAKEHLAAVAPSPECERAEEASPEREALLEAFALRDRMLALVKRGDRLGLGREFERLLTVDHPSVVIAANAPMTVWRGDLVPKQSVVRIIDDVEEFQRLCERPAPGGEEEVGWCEDEMEELAGKEYTVDGINEDLRSYRVDSDSYWVPFDACILVKV